MLKYIRAFVKTIQLMLKGEMIEAPPERCPNLQAWVAHGKTLAEQAFTVAEQNGFDEAKRKKSSLISYGRKKSSAVRV